MGIYIYIYIYVYIRYNGVILYNASNNNTVNKIYFTNSSYFPICKSGFHNNSVNDCIRLLNDYMILIIMYSNIQWS